MVSRKLVPAALALLLMAPIPARADGELDSSFATEGVAIVNLGAPPARVAGVRVGPGGRIVVAGDFAATSGRDLVVAAFTASGAPDPSFAGTGRVTADFGGDEEATGLAIDRDGSVVVVGTRTKDGRREAVLLRYLANGTLDAAFNGGGRRVLSFTDGVDNIGSAVAIDLDGRIVVGGTRINQTGSLFAVARLLPDGSLDTTLNSNGKRFIDFGVDNGTNASAAAVAVQDDRKIVIAGTRVGAHGSDFAVARLNADGSFDTGFDGSGKTAIDFGATDVAHALAIRSDGGIAVAGVRTTATGSDFAIAVLRQDGQPDTAFKGNGKATTDFGGDETAFALDAQPDGLLVAVGERLAPAGRDFAVARYRLDGTPDPALDGDGKVRVDLAASDSATGVALQQDGRLVVAGTTGSGTPTDLAIVRILSTENGSAGTLEIPAPDSHQSGIGLISGWLCDASSISVRMDGKPLVPTAYGTPRADTAGVCGDTNNGFGLLFNWGLIGDGPHVLRAFADGRQFAMATFDVTTLGTPFLRGATGTFTLPGFPVSGESVDVGWEEGLQRFMIRRFAKAGSASAVAGTGDDRATSAAVSGVLENPAAGSFQSGIGIISGWVCDAKVVQVRLDSRPFVRAAYGTTRGDTQAVCGDTNNGFGLLFNWSLLGDGVHTIEVRADNAVIGNGSFTVTTLGKTFLRGAHGSYPLADFPQSGKSVDVTWDEGQQGFVVVDVH